LGVLELLLNPFDLALSGSKSAKIVFEEFERVSEEIEGELLGGVESSS